MKPGLDNFKFQSNMRVKKKSILRTYQEIDGTISKGMLTVGTKYVPT